MRIYIQLTQEQRYQIFALLKMDHNRTEIACVLGVHKSTISRELSRNHGRRGYRPAGPSMGVVQAQKSQTSYSA
jgi:IS30 family transposase